MSTIDQVGRGALAAVVETALPEACEMVHNAAGELTIDNLVWHVEDILNLMASLHNQQVLTQYIPAPPPPECRRQIHAIPATVSLENLCTGWVVDGTLECLKNLSDSVDRVGLLREMLGKGFLRGFIEADLVKACGVISDFSAQGISMEVIASGIDWYVDLYTGLPAFLKELLPPYPLKKCPKEVSSFSHFFLNIYKYK